MTLRLVNRDAFNSHVWVGYTEDSPDNAYCHECNCRVTDPRAELWCEG